MTRAERVEVSAGTVSGDGASIAAAGSVSNKNVVFGPGKLDQSKPLNIRGLWIAIIAVAVLLGGGTVVYQLARPDSSAPTMEEAKPAGISIDLNNADACSAITPEQQRSLSLSSERDYGRKSALKQCKYDNTRLGTDLLVVYNTASDVRGQIADLSRETRQEVTSTPIKLGNLSATEIRVFDAQYQHMNCFVAFDVQPMQVLLAWASDIRGDDATMSQLCDNAEATFSTIAGNF